MMEDNVSEVEAALKAKEKIPVRIGPYLNAEQRIQWALTFFTVLAGGEAAHADHATGAKGSSLHFDAFICVDLLPVLVRILKANPHPDTALCIGFLLSSVSGSPTIIPH